MEIPSYIWIENVDFHTDRESELEQGTASHKITDVWITANGNSLGMYQLPARIPILEHGATNLTIDAGIMDGGVSVKRVVYPFYTPYSLTADLKKGQIDTLFPSFTYMKNTKFYLMENFDAGTYFTAYGTSAPLNRTSDASLIFQQPKESNIYSGMIELPYVNDTATVYHFEIRTINPVELTYEKVYYCMMEINYCITDNIEIGMITHSSSSAYIDLQIPLANLVGNNTNNESPIWKKAYVNFSQEIGVASGTQMKNFDIYIRGTISSKTKNARFLFDNIKLVYN
jgi:hypothetical protein